MIYQHFPECLSVSSLTQTSNFLVAVLQSDFVFLLTHWRYLNMTRRCQVRRADQPADRKQEVPFSTHLAASYCLALIMVSSMVLLTRVLMSDVKVLRASDRVLPLLDINFWASAFTPNSTWQRHKKRECPHSATPTDPSIPSNTALFPLPVILKKTRSETYNQAPTEMFCSGSIPTPCFPSVLFPDVND